MQTITSSGLAEFLEQTPLWGTHTMIFRGVSDSAYALAPSLGRITGNTPGRLRQFEEQTLEEFERRAAPYLDLPPTTKLQWMCLAQHHGLPTRLLDWTGNPLMALYFACAKTSPTDCAVYKRVQPRWIAHSESADPLTFADVLAVRPAHTHVRYMNQESVLTVHPIPSEPLDDVHTAKYVFPAALKSEMRRRLRIMGMRASFVFPGLDSVAEDVRADCAYTLTGAVPGANPTIGPF